MAQITKLEEAIISDKLHGMSDIEIGRKYKITYRQLEKILRKATGISISAIKKEKKIKRYAPQDFREESTTVWSFKSRGDWATHSGEYRGNWSPYIPRNVILKYSKPGDVVLDYFCGAGTTAVEAKLLGRKCIAFDINDKAIELAKKNINFTVPEEHLPYQVIYEPELFVGDARDLSFLKNESIDLICAHPPYANIIHYTNHKKGDLSFLCIEDYLKEMEKVARESYRVLKPGHQCAILIGDMRRHKHIIPLGFELINIYLDAGFKLKELVIKRQHNCKTTGFWYENSIKHNFLLLAHEYLPIFEKPITEIAIKEETSSYGPIYQQVIKSISKKKLSELETTTVWIFPEKEFEDLLDKNVVERYRDGKSFRIINLISNSDSLKQNSSRLTGKYALLFIKSPCLNKKNISKQDISIYLDNLKMSILNESQYINSGGYCVIQSRDIRINEYIEPVAKYIVDSIKFPDLLLKEIVIITSENYREKLLENSKYLEIVHQYLLVYKVARCEIELKD